MPVGWGSVQHLAGKRSTQRRADTIDTSTRKIFSKYIGFSERIHEVCTEFIASDSSELDRLSIQPVNEINDCNWYETRSKLPALTSIDPDPIDLGAKTFW
jgi:hypothetical protein